MAYIKMALAADEDVLHNARFHWTYSIAPTFWLMLGLTPLIIECASIATGHGSIVSVSYLYRILAGVSFLLGAFLWLTKMIPKWTTQIVITTARFIYKTGLIARDAHEVGLDNIEEVALGQTFLGRLFGFGHIKVRGTGIGVIELPPLAHPLLVQRRIEEAQRGLRRMRTQAA